MPNLYTTTAASPIAPPDWPCWNEVCASRTAVRVGVLLTVMLLPTALRLLLELPPGGAGLWAQSRG
jgi:hypothetical protein